MTKQLSQYFLFTLLLLIVNIYIQKLLLTVFDEQEFGKYRLLISIFTVIGVISLKGTDWSIMRYTIDKNKSGIRGELLKSIKFNSAALCMLLLITSLLFDSAFTLIGRNEILLCLCIAFFNPLEFVFGALKGLEKTHVIKISTFVARLIFLTGLYLSSLISGLSIIYTFAAELIILYIVYILAFRVSVLPEIQTFNNQKEYTIYNQTSSKFSLQSAISLICSHTDKILLGAFSTSDLGLLYLTTFLTDNIKSQLKPVFLMFSIRNRKKQKEKSYTIKIVLILMGFAISIAVSLFAVYPFILSFISSKVISNHLIPSALILSCLSLIPYSMSSYLASLDLIKNGAASANIMIFQQFI